MIMQSPKPRPPLKRRNASEITRLQSSISESQELFHQIFHRSPIAIVLSRVSDGRFFDANASFLELTEYTLEDIIGRTAIDLALTPNSPTREERLAHFKQHGRLTGLELIIKCKSGAVRYALTTVTVVMIQGEEFALSMLIDITDRKHAEQKLAQIQRLYATLSQVNQMIVRVRDRNELYQSICNIAVEFGKFSFAWIGLLDEDSGELRPVAATGLDVGNWPFEMVNIRRGKLKNGLTARAVRTNRVITSEDVQHDKRLQKNLDQIRNFDFHSSAVIPFRLRGKVIGVVGMISNQAGLFKAKEELHLLEEMSLDISFAIDKIQLENEHRQAEEQVRAQSARLAILARASDAFVQPGQDYNALLNHVVYLVADALADTCYIRLLSDDGQRLDVVALHMKDPQVAEVWGKVLLQQELRPEDETSMVARVFRLGQPVFIPVLRAEMLKGLTSPKIWHLLDNLPPHSILVTPLSVQGRNIGALVLIRHLPEQPSFTEDDLNLAQDLSNRAALVIHNARLFAQVQNELDERKRVEATRDQLARIVEASEDAILSKTLEGIITSWNHGAERLYGYTAEEAIGQSISLVIPPERPNELAEIIGRIQRGEYVKHFETVRVRKDRTRVDASVTISPIRNDAGDIIGASTIARDITERKNAERRLSESEAHLRAIHDALAEGVAFIDMNGTIMSKNDAADKVLGRAVEELTDPQLGARLRVVRSDGAPFPFNEQPAFVALHSGQPVRNVEMGIPARDGTLKWTVVNAQLVRDLIKDTTLGVVVSFFDITDRKRAEQQIRNQLQHLNSLREIDTAILSSVGMKIGLDAVVSRAILELNVDAADILVLNSKTHSLEYRSGWGFDTHAIQNHIVPLGQGLAGRCALEHQSIYISDLREHAAEFTRSKALVFDEKFIAYYCVPLIENENVKGVLEIFHRSPLDPDLDWIDFLYILAGQATIAIQSATLFEGLQRSNSELAQAYDATIEGWSRAMDLRDKETAGHTQRVTEMTLELAQEMGVSSDEMVHIRRGALLHDMGKLGVPDEVLLKPGKLTDEEWVAMKKHPQHAYDMLSSISYLLPALDIPYCHHEKWDGTGYPRGLKGEEIPLAARLFAVVDVWDALRSDRPYRPSWPQEKVLEHIRAGSGTHFDPHAVETFMKIMAEKEAHH